MRASTRNGLAAAVLGFWLASPVWAVPAQSAGAFAPHSAKSHVLEQLRLPDSGSATAVALPPVDPQAIASTVSANGKSLTKRLQIGIGREVPDPVAASAGALRWSAVGGGFAAQWQVTSPGAAALRIELEGSLSDPGIEIRLSGLDEPDVVYGPLSPAGLQAAGYWSPVLEGESAIVEVFAPSLRAGLALDLRISRVSHLFVSPADPLADRIAKASQACEVDLICRSAGDSALANAGRSVARMTFSDGQSAGTFLCTGTLLNTTNNSFIPYFYSAHHCINTQASANTLTTHWFYDRTGCGSGVLSPSYVQLPGGAALLYSSAFYDALLLRLNGTPPNGAFFSGWDSASLSGGTALTAIHHPAGDFKKVSLGTMGGFGSPSGSGANFIIANWNSIATGVTEGGSSGSGIFTLQGSEYRLRGGLYGGPSSCNAPPGSLHDYYSRFDQVYSSIAQYLSPAASTCTYSLSPTSVTVGSGAASGSVTVTTGAGCAWSASSDSPWLATSSSGSGPGTVTYSIAANTQGTSRIGTLTIAGRPFTVTQQAPLTTGTNLVANGGFETGTASWSQSASGGFPIIFQNTAQQAIARSGSWYAWLGGYDNAIDTLYQDITIPPGAGARLQFWYFITTHESPTTTTAFDTMVVSVANPLTGARLATLATFSNVSATSGWVQSGQLDLSAFSGQTVRLMFVAETDFSQPSNFFLDDITVSATAASGATNHTALWWNPNESGWGVNFNHQGDIVFGTLFTYDSARNPMWLVMPAGAQQSGQTFSGTLYRTTGPPFNASPWTGPAAATTVGTMTVTFSGNTAVLNYSVDGVSVNKNIEKQVFSQAPASCQPTNGDRTSLTNYQDLWWASPPGSEDGWGLNLTHQGNTLFATLFNYGANRQGLWLVMSNGARQADGSYLGELFQTSGPGFDTVPFTGVTARAVGTMRLRFTNGTSGTLTYSVDGVTVTKNITRQLFRSSGLPACSS